MQPTRDMSLKPILDEEYASEEDSDFAPDAAPAETTSEASESEDGSEQPAPTAKRKRAADDDAADVGYENSGDEAIISKGKKRQKKAKRKHDVPGDDDEGGDGGLIKTRSMRAVGKQERKTAAVTGPITVDVNDIWAKMTAGPVVPPKASADKEKTRPDDSREPAVAKDREMDKSQLGKPGEAEPSVMIKIKRTYNFAGKIHIEEKMVPRGSAEAEVYLASLSGNPKEAADADGDAEPRKKPRKAFRSIFEPISEGLMRRADLNLGVAARLQMREQGKAKKLNVVEKSRMDWAGFVDKEGIKDDLELAGKSKESFASRQDFLARVEAKREDDARRARMAGRA
ncbi:bucentaur or craniofacial development-domain-containing protein [Pseudomassariella vexata]|uniref:SWR1-complex protein 5 n=1 Tax=Pseudomassariella vexata TaxID=1141098 RepID=A0A1Y2EFF2_9PEZI|nr:bucentaur or craniofacial development-domain-containing protein [Pseudomassariella vexata]ORY70137.1 bucentaur or craniofacial development-domain-containing protein [Pseudomassariella vexata]